MNSDTVLDDINFLLQTHLDVKETVNRDTHLTRDLQLDSIQQMTLVVELENHFRICFNPGDDTGITTIGHVVDLVQSGLAAEETQGEK